MEVIGIDLGTTNSLAAVWRDGKAILIPNSLGGYLTPSVVSVDEDGTVWTGAVAKEKRISQPGRSADAFKRHMGTNKQIPFGDRSYTPQELSALVLRQLKEDAECFLGEPVAEAVISVPAYFNDEQRYATKEAGLLAGLKVERLVNEPSAAALACRQAGDGEDTEFLVIDFGGGTLDVSVVECFDQLIEILAVSGDNHLGGIDFDTRIAEHFCEEHQLRFDLLTRNEQAILLKKSEQCKRELTENQAAMIEYAHRGEKLGMFLTRDQLIEISASLFKRLEQVVLRALRDAHKTIREIDQIVLVGGTCKMPVVRRYIHQFLGMEPVLTGQPDEIVALGAGIYAGIKERKAEISEVILTDICPFTLGVGTLDCSNYGDLCMSPVIERNSSLPVSKVHYYVTTGDGQTQIRVKVYQGESMHCSQNLQLGELEIAVPAAPKGQEGVEVRFTYDINGILEVEVTNCRGETARKVILNERVRMSEEELEYRMKELELVKQNPREDERNQLVLSRADRLYAESLGRDRETIVYMVQWFSEILQKGNQAEILTARKRVEDALDFIEKRLDSGEL